MAGTLSLSAQKWGFVSSWWRVFNRSLRDYQWSSSGLGTYNWRARRRQRSARPSSPLRRAAEEGRIRRAPTEGIELPPVESEERRLLSVQEIGHLADSIDLRYRAMVLVAATTGARYGELAAIRRNRLDLKSRTLTDSSLTADGRTTPPKTGASRRTVRLPEWIVPVMRQHLADHAGAKPRSRRAL